MEARKILDYYDSESMKMGSAEESYIHTPWIEWSIYDDWERCHTVQYLREHHENDVR